MWLDSLNTFEFVVLYVAVVVVTWIACDWIFTRIVRRWRRGARHAEPVRRQSLATFDRATRREDRRPIRERLRADVAQRGYPAAVGFNHDERSDWPIPESAPRTRATSNCSRHDDTGYATTRLTRTPDEAA